jgi:IS5 family transposase
MHVLSDANGLPLVVGVSAANVHDSEGLKPMVAGHQTRHDPHRGRYFKPQRLHADKAYDIPYLRKWLRGKRIGVRIARKGVESSSAASTSSRMMCVRASKVVKPETSSITSAMSARWRGSWIPAISM